MRSLGITPDSAGSLRSIVSLTLPTGITLDCLVLTSARSSMLHFSWRALSFLCSMLMSNRVMLSAVLYKSVNLSMASPMAAGSSVSFTLSRIAFTCGAYISRFCLAIAMSASAFILAASPASMFFMRSAFLTPKNFSFMLFAVFCKS